MISQIKKTIHGFRYLEVPINRCVHFCGFRYGINSYNPYESYITDIQQGVSVKLARRHFIEFLKYYRPHEFGEALGLTSLSQKYPLWIYPWNKCSPKQFTLKRCWVDDPNDLPDIMTHFCEKGILSYRIDQEFFWGERALYVISNEGYMPDKYSSYVNILELQKKDKTSVFLVLDGNHRVSAMSALGYRTIEVKQNLNHTILEKDSNQWYGVRKGFYNQKDALLIFNAYFEGNSNYRIAIKPAEVIAPASWFSLYF